MRSLPTLFYCRSLSFSLLALAFSIIAGYHILAVAVFAGAFGFSVASIALHVILTVVANAVNIHAVINLIRDVERGYSPSRCSLAAVILLLAFVISVALAVSVLEPIWHARETA